MIDLDRLRAQNEALTTIALPATERRIAEINNLIHWATIAASHIKAHQCEDEACGAALILRAIGVEP